MSKKVGGKTVVKTAAKVIEQTADAGLLPEELEELKLSFAIFDKDGNGNISKEELKDILLKLKISDTKGTLDKIMNDIDKNKSNTIDADEFAEMFTCKLPEVEDRKTLGEIYDYMCDFANVDSINLDALKTLNDEFGVGLTDEEMQLMIEKADTNKDGVVSNDEYYTIITKKI
jgi:Ca2+-binding EF-hand superfamily protein